MGFPEIGSAGEQNLLLTLKQKWRSKRHNLVPREIERRYLVDITRLERWSP